MSNWRKQECPVCGRTQKVHLMGVVSATVCEHCGHELFLTSKKRFEEIRNNSIKIRGKIARAIEKYESEIVEVVTNNGSTIDSIIELKKNLDSKTRKIANFNKDEIFREYSTLVNKKKELESILNASVVDDNIAQIFFVEADRMNDRIIVRSNCLLRKSWEVAIIYSNCVITDFRDAAEIELITIPFEELRSQAGTELIYYYNYTFLPNFEYIYFRQYIKG